jgi:hypothetical protein
MKAKEFLEWYRYSRVGGKRMHSNYGLLRKHNPSVFKKLADTGKFKYEKDEMGKVLEFPKKLEEK